MKNFKTKQVYLKEGLSYLCVKVPYSSLLGGPIAVKEFFAFRLILAYKLLQAANPCFLLGFF